MSSVPKQGFHALTRAEKKIDKKKIDKLVIADSSLRSPAEVSQRFVAGKGSSWQLALSLSHLCPRKTSGTKKPQKIFMPQKIFEHPEQLMVETVVPLNESQEEFEIFTQPLNLNSTC